MMKPAKQYIGGEIVTENFVPIIAQMHSIHKFVSSYSRGIPAIIKIHIMILNQRPHIGINLIWFKDGHSNYISLYI